MVVLPFGKHTENYRKNTMLLIGKPSINGPFSIAVLVYQRVQGSPPYLAKSVFN